MTYSDTVRSILEKKVWVERFHPRDPDGKFSLRGFRITTTDPIPAFAGHVGKPWYGVENWSDVSVDDRMLKERSDAYANLPDFDTSVAPQFDHMMDQLKDQYKILTVDMGVKVEVMDHDPYPDVESMLADLKQGRLKVLGTAATPPGHPYYTNEENDIFRAVHDAFGHGGTGRGFDRHGEEAAYEAHANMFDEAGRQVLATELRAQNAALIVTGDFVDQKLGLLDIMHSKTASPDDDNAYGQTGVHHTSNGRHKRQVTPEEQAAWDERRNQIRSETKDFDPRLHPRDLDGRFTPTEVADASNALRSEGGFTYQPVVNRSPKVGLAVSPFPDRSRAIPYDQMAPDDIMKYADDNSDLLEDSNNYIGAWHNPDDDMVVLDISIVAPNREAAERVSRKYEQEAFYDLETGETVYVIPGAASQHYGKSAEGSPPDPREADPGGSSGTDRRPGGVGSEGEEVKKFDPNQPRIPSGKPGAGRWGVVSAILDRAATPVDTMDTYRKYRRDDGTWEPERQALHDEIVADALKGHDSSSNPTVFLLGGGPAAGKSTMISSGLEGIPHGDEAVLIAADDLKPLLPEYAPLVASGNVAAGAIVHEEASYLSKRILSEATTSDLDMVYDAMGNTTLESLTAKIEKVKAAGHRVKAVYVTVPTDVALKRADDRGKRTGRFVPPSVITETHRHVSQIFGPAARAGLFDEADLYETVGSPPAHVATYRNGEFVILDEAKWAQFEAKGEES